MTGIVLRTDERSGNKVQDDGSSRAWKMTTAKVLVGGEDLIEVTIPDEKLLLCPGKGEAVDWLVRIRHNGGKYLNIDLSGEWTAEHDAQSS
ncbi:hypothetical protein [Nocardioides sp. HB32]